MRRTLESLLDLMLWRDGGQRVARRNAWAAMVADSARARARAEAGVAMTAVAAVTAPVSSGHGAHG